MRLLGRVPQPSTPHPPVSWKSVTEGVHPTAPDMSLPCFCLLQGSKGTFFPCSNGETEAQRATVGWQVRGCP